jgi:3-polyprenyl-4-hydroxybenzoate decarboxylase
MWGAAVVMPAAPCFFSKTRSVGDLDKRVLRQLRLSDPARNPMVKLQN